MKHLLYIPLISLCCILSSCSDEESFSIPTYDTYRRSVVVYLAAQNSLGDVGASRLDSAEIVRGASKLTDPHDNVFLFIDDMKKPRLYRICRYRNNTFYPKVLAWSTDLCSSDPATLRDLLKYVSTNYPSESYGLVMWSHADGWLMANNTQNTLGNINKSFGMDVGPDGDPQTDTDASGNIGASMNISDMADAIALSGVHLDYIFFDACLMQCVEAAYELRNVTNYIVASATSTSAYGGYYENLIPNALFAYPATDENIALISQQYYYDAVENPDLKSKYNNTGNAISTIKTQYLEQLAQATAQYISPLFAEKMTPSLDDIQMYMNSRIFNAPNYYDMGSAAHKLLPEEDYQNWLSIAGKCVIDHHVSNSYIIGYINGMPVENTLFDPDHVLGVSMFLPQKKYNAYPYDPFNTQFKKTSWYRDAGWEVTGW